MKRASLLIALVLPLLLASHAYAGSVTLTLSRVSLTGVTDAAGSWQYEGGKIFRGATQIGNYAVMRRITTGGTDAQSTAMVTITLFFFSSLPPENITLQGSHDFSSGAYIGGVSAASNRYAWIRGATFTGTAGATGSLTITWVGTFPFALP
jgi:hypothetical protein